jgi:hypothetical protein
MKKYEIYLPLKYNDGTEIEAEKIKQIREELIAVFGALTVSSQSAPYQEVGSMAAWILSTISSRLKSSPTPIGRLKGFSGNTRNISSGFSNRSIS